LPEIRAKGDKRTEEAKLQAAIKLATGAPMTEVAKDVGISRVTLWRWMTSDDTFIELRTRLVNETVASAVTELRSLSEDAIGAFRRGLRADTRYVLGPEGEKIGLPDDSLAVRTADIVTKRIPEFAPHLDVTLSGSLETRLRELDESGIAAVED
jgi:AcrR family transcriptional regulator